MLNLLEAQVRTVDGSLNQKRKRRYVISEGHRQILSSLVFHEVLLTHLII
jgi:hypothetical protein